MINARLDALRLYMQDMQIHALIIPTNDPHFSEYPPEHWEIRAWISGFSGSAGKVVVTRDKAGLWTDSRYFIQAEQELAGTGIDLHKVHDRSSPGITDWLLEELAEGQTLAVFKELVSLSEWDHLKQIMGRQSIEVTAVDDFFDTIWTDRPSLPLDQVFEHNIQFTGRSRMDKLNTIRQHMQELNCDAHLVTTLDDIAWILNLRSTDVACNPVFISYLLIEASKATLFIKLEKLSAELRQQLNNVAIDVEEYENVYKYLNSMPSSQFLLDESLVNYKLYKSLEHHNFNNGQAPSVLLKACKTPHETEQFRNAMVKDGAALTRAFYWLEQQLSNNSVITEFEFGQRLSYERSQQEHYYGESFNAIVGYRSNGAIVHYRADATACKTIENQDILLVDSGGQYHDGTTDITRTVALGPASIEQMKAYTAVLKGMIDLTMSVFPIGTSGTQLDTFARQHLWKLGLGFTHGTGHGVGFFNSVHEGPQRIAPSCRSSAKLAIKEGMICSNEPGYYKEGEYGIRIENLILCRASTHEGYLQFETLTLFPIDTQLVLKEDLATVHIQWLNDYHQNVFNALSPLLDENHRNWLQLKCELI